MPAEDSGLIFDADDEPLGQGSLGRFSGWSRPTKAEVVFEPDLLKLLARATIVVSPPFKDVVPPVAARAQKELLVEFLRMDGWDKADVVRFVKRWGLLGVGKHGIVRSRFPPEPPTLSERLASWLALRRQFENVLMIGEALRNEKAPDVALWEPIREAYGDSILWRWPTARSPLKLHRTVLTAVLNRWLSAHDVVVSFSWNERPELQFAGSLLGFLTSQLVAEMVGAPGVFFCNGGCGLPFIPMSRAPKRNQRTWCPECRVHARANQAQRDAYPRPANVRKEALPGDTAISSISRGPLRADRVD